MIKPSKRTDMLRREWHGLSQQLSSLLDEGERTSIYDERGRQIVFEARAIRRRIAEIAKVIEYDS